MTPDNNTPNDAEWWWDQAALLVWEALCWWPIWLPVAWLATIGRWAASSLIAAGAPELVGWPAAIVVTAPVGLWCWHKQLPITRRRRREAGRRRRITQALIDSGLATTGERPVISNVVATAYGTTVEIKAAPHRTAADINNHSVKLAVALGAKAVVAVADDEAPGVVHLRIRARDPLMWHDNPPRWPLLEDPRPTSLTQPVPVAITEDGEIQTIELWCSSLLIGGQTGSGKSTSLWLVALAAAADPLAELWVIDAKGGMELQALARLCRPDRFVVRQDEAVALLTELLAEVHRRQDACTQLGLRQIPPSSPQWPPLVLIIDELAEITASGTRNLDTEANRLLRRLLSIGRATGITVVAATQRPSADVLDTGAREQFVLRWAMRTAARAASIMILGEDAVATGAKPHAVPSLKLHRGIGYLTDGEATKRVRSYYLDDPAITAAIETIATWRR
jgi:S-DNA-T family DNA segregation ATPase FtsK/SpoIIIE